MYPGKVTYTLVVGMKCTAVTVGACGGRLGVSTTSNPSTLVGPPSADAVTPENADIVTIVGVSATTTASARIGVDGAVEAETLPPDRALSVGDNTSIDSTSEALPNDR